MRATPTKARICGTMLNNAVSGPRSCGITASAGIAVLKKRSAKHSVSDQFHTETESFFLYSYVRLSSVLISLFPSVITSCFIRDVSMKSTAKCTRFSSIRRFFRDFRLLTVPEVGDQDTSLCHIEVSRRRSLFRCL